MFKIKTFILIFSTIFISACVSQEEFLSVKETLSTEIEQKDNLVSTLKGQLDNCDKEKNQCQTELSETRIRLKQLEKETMDLNTKLENLLREKEDVSLELQKKASIIQLQDGIIGQLNDTKKKIEESMKDQIQSQQIKLTEMEGKLKVTFVDKILFDTGSAVPSPKGKELLKEIANSMKDNTFHNISVEGHTDDVPIGGGLKSIYPTNWELSVARATSVVRFLHEIGGLAPEILSAAGYSFYRPLETNDTPEGRSQNRRIEIVLIPKR